MRLKNDFGLENRGKKASLLNPPSHDSVKDRVAWHLKQDLEERFGRIMLHDEAIEIIDAYVEQSDFPGIGEQMTKRPHEGYITDDQGASRIAVEVSIFAQKYLEEEKGEELKRREYTSYGYY